MAKVTENLTIIDVVHDEDYRDTEIIEKGQIIADPWGEALWESMLAAHDV